MTTYRLNGAAAFSDAFGLDYLAARDPGVRLEIVVPDTVTTFRYTLNPPAPGEPVGTAVIDFNDYKHPFRRADLGGWQLCPG